MITNERQYRITKAESERFRKAIADSERAGSDLSLRLRQAAIDGLLSQLKDLEREIELYEAVKRGEHQDVEITSLDDLPEVLILARIASGMTQADLAARLGIHEQQIQRYESTYYAGASLSRLIETAEALGLSIRGTARLPESETLPTG